MFPIKNLDKILTPKAAPDPTSEPRVFHTPKP